jgi:hypothetical protein
MVWHSFLSQCSKYWRSSLENINNIKTRCTKFSVIFLSFLSFLFSLIFTFLSFSYIIILSDASFVSLHFHSHMPLVCVVGTETLHITFDEWLGSPNWLDSRTGGLVGVITLEHSVVPVSSCCSEQNSASLGKKREQCISLSPIVNFFRLFGRSRPTG